MPAFFDMMSSWYIGSNVSEQLALLSSGQITGRRIPEESNLPECF